MRRASLLATFVASLSFVSLACTPSGSSARQPAMGGDSAPESARESAEDPAPGGDPPEQEGAAIPAPPPVQAVRPVAVPRASGAYRVRLVDQAHHDLPTYAYGGRSYVMGTVGARYSIVIVNPTAERVEAVISVDGLDALDGHPASYASKRGYILPAHGDMTVDGFRTSMDEVATFRFSSVADSYAGRLGQARDVGVIGVAFFPERPEVAVWRPSPAERSADAPSPAPARPSYRSPAKDSVEPAAPAPPPRAQAGGGAPATGAASRAAPPAAVAPEERRGLGTEFGEARESRVGSTSFDRANPGTPLQVVSLRYNDRAGLVALGIPIPMPYADDEVRTRETADPFRQNGFAKAPPPRY